MTETDPTNPKYLHAICAIEARKRPGPRVTLCGDNRTGPRQSTTGKPVCPRCAPLVPAHRATCLVCAEIGFFAAPWPAGSPREQQV